MRFVKRTLPLWLCLIALAIGMTTAAILDGQPPATTEKPASAAEKYLPDERPRPAPDSRPNRQRTIYADEIILDGRDARIIITATGAQPGITIHSKRSGEFAIVYLNRDGRAIMGIKTPARKELAVGIFASDKEREGYLQLSDPWGVHVLDGQDLGIRRGTGAIPKR